MYDNALGRFSSMDRLAELAPSISPFRFAFNNPVYWSDPSGLYEVDKNGNISITDEEEVKKFMSYLNNNSNASVDDMSEHIFNADNGFVWELPGVTITGSGGNGDIQNQVQNSLNQISSFNGNINFKKDSSVGEWLWDNKKQIGGTLASGLNAYAGYGEFVAGMAMMAAPTGVTQAAGAYSIADGFVRMATAPFQIFGTWTGNTSLENMPSNLLGSIGFAADNFSHSGITTGGNTQVVMELMGNFGLSRQKLIQAVTTGFSNPNKIKNMINIGNATWQIVRPYKDAISAKDKL